MGPEFRSQRIGMLSFDLSDPVQSSEVTRRFGLHCSSDGKKNFVHVPERSTSLAGVLSFNGELNHVRFGENCRFHGEVVAIGSDSETIIEGGQHTLNLRLTLYNSAKFRLGKRTVSYGLRVWVGNGLEVEIGEDCLFSEGVTIRTTDHHAIFDVVECQVINQGRGVRICSDVWIGQQVSLLKGAEVHRGSIVGGNSVVPGCVPPFELWAGVPARMIREKVSWIDPEAPTVEELRARRDALGWIDGV